MCGEDERSNMSEKFVFRGRPNFMGFDKRTVDSLFVFSALSLRLFVGELGVLSGTFEARFCGYLKLVKLDF